MAALKNWKKPEYNNSEQLLKRQILDWLARQPECVPLMYQAMRGGRQADGSFKPYSSPYMPPGVSDILCCWKGLFLAIEVKRPDGSQLPLQAFEPKKQTKGKVTHHQQNFIERIKRARGIAFVAYSIDDVIRALKPELLAKQVGGPVERKG